MDVVWDGYEWNGCDMERLCMGWVWYRRALYTEHAVDDM